MFLVCCEICCNAENSAALENGALQHVAPSHANSSSSGGTTEGLALSEQGSQQQNKAHQSHAHKRAFASWKPHPPSSERPESSDTHTSTHSSPLESISATTSTASEFVQPLRSHPQSEAVSGAQSSEALPLTLDSDDSSSSSTITPVDAIQVIRAVSSSDAVLGEESVPLAMVEPASVQAQADGALVGDTLADSSQTEAEKQPGAFWYFECLITLLSLMKESAVSGHKQLYPVA